MSESQHEKLAAAVADRFPNFARLLREGRGGHVEYVEEPATAADIANLNLRAEHPLPQSYLELVQRSKGFWLHGGTVQLTDVSLVVHDFPKWEELSSAQQQSVRHKGGNWPPPSQGMLCFAECWLEADGDQVLFDVSNGLVNGEYPVYYYSHEDSPPSVTRVAGGFEEWLEGLLEHDYWDEDSDEEEDED